MLKKCWTDWLILMKVGYKKERKVPYFCKKFPPLNSFHTLVRKLFKFSLHKRVINTETIWNFQDFTNSKKNSFRGNYSRKYGTFKGFCIHEPKHNQLQPAPQVGSHYHRCQPTYFKSTHERMPFCFDDFDFFLPCCKWSRLWRPLFD